MQCRNCGFENMPGIDTCVVCSSSLTSKANAEGVLPPRAKDRKILQRVSYSIGLDSSLLRLRQGLSELKNRQITARSVVEPQWWHVLLCVIPGVGTVLALGQLASGVIQFLIALFLLYIASVLSGTIIGGLATSTVVSLSIFSVFVFADKYWGSKQKGISAWISRVGMLAAIMAFFYILNYYLGYFNSLLRLFRYIVGN